MNKIVNERLRDHIARVLGPSPFDFRGRPFLSREKAVEIADMVVDEIEKHPEKGASILRAAYGMEDMNGR